MALAKNEYPIAGLPKISLRDIERGPRRPPLRPPLSAPPKIPTVHIPSAGTARHPAITGFSTPSVTTPKVPTKTEQGLTKSSQQKATPLSAPYVYHPPSGASGGLTASQVAQLMATKQQHPTTSLFDEIKSGAGSILGFALHQVSRPGWAVSSAVDSAINDGFGTNILSHAEAGFAGREQNSFEKILKEHHILDDHTILQTIGGIGLDMVLDPTNLLLIAAAPETGGATGMALLIKEGLVKSMTEAGGKATFKDVVMAAAKDKAPGLEVNYEKVLAETPFGGTGKNLGEATLEDVKAMSPEELGTSLKALQGSQTMAAIRKSAELLAPRKISVGLWLPTLMGTKKLLITDARFLRMMPYAPNLLRTAEGLTPLSHIPGVKHIAEAVGSKFKPYWRDPALHATMMGQKHTADSIYQFINKTMHAPLIERWTKPGIAHEHLADALDVATQEGAAVEHADLTHTVNEDFLRQHGLDDEQVAFVHDWNDAMNKQLRMEVAYGVPIDTAGIGNRVYVPYRMEKGYVAGGYKVSGATKQFQHAREGQYSLAQFREMAKARGSEFKDVVTNPADLLQGRLRQGAQAMSHAGWRQGMADLFGVPARVIDPEGIAHLGGVAEGATKRLADHQQLVADLPTSRARDLAELNAKEAEHVAQTMEAHDAGIVSRRETASQLRHDESLYTRAREAAVAQRRLATRGIGKPLARRLTGLMKRSQTVDDLKALWATDAKDAVATNFDLNTVTDRQIALARKQVYEATQKSLEARGLPERMVVYRAGKLGKGVQSFSLEPVKGFGKQQAYLVDRANVLADANAFFPGAHVLENEVLVKAEQVEKTATHDVIGDKAVQAKRQEVKNAKAKAGRAGATVAREEGNLMATANALMQHTADSRIQDISENASARVVREAQRALDRQVDSLAKENKALQRQFESMGVQQEQLRRETDGSIEGLHARQQQAFDQAQQAMLDHVDQMIEEKIAGLKLAHGELGPARNRVATAQSEVERLTPAKGKKLTAAKQAELDAAKKELRSAKAALKKVEERTTHINEKGQMVANVRQKAGIGVKEIREQLALALRDRWNAIQAKAIQLAETHGYQTVTEGVGKIPGRQGQIYDAMAEEMDRIRLLEAKVSAVRAQPELRRGVKTGRTITAKEQLYQLIGAEGKKYGGLVDLIDKIGKGRINVVDNPDLQELQRLRADVQRATTGQELDALMPGHHSLDAFEAGGKQLSTEADKVERINQLNHERNAIRDRQIAIKGQLEHALLASAEHKAEHAAEFKQSAEFQAKGKARAKEGERLHGEWQKAIARQAQAVKNRDLAHAEGLQRLQELHDMGAVEAPSQAVRHHQRTYTRLEREANQMEAARPAVLQKAQLRYSKAREAMNAGHARSQAEAFRMEDKLEADAQEALAKAAQGSSRLDPRILSGELKRLDEFPDVAFPPEVHDALTRVEAIMQRPEEMQKVIGAIHRLMAKWKVNVTVLNFPGYRIRNTLSDVWNMYFNGMPLRAVVPYFIKAHAMLGAAKHDPKVMAFLMRAEYHGAMQGLFRGDIDHAYQMYRHGEKAAKRQLWRRYVRYQINLNTRAENTGRLAHLLWRMDHASHRVEEAGKLVWRKEDMAHAAFEVRRSHFDYEDLTPFEQQLKGIFPFYTWTRKNVPYQVAQFIQRPGRAAAWSHVVQDLETASGTHKGELIPPYFDQAGAIRIPGIGPRMYWLPGIGLMDISRMIQGRGPFGLIPTPRIQGVTSMLGPDIQIPASLITNYNLFTGAPIASAEHGRAPVNPFFADMVSKIPFLGDLMNVGMTQRKNAQGHYVKSAGIDPKWLWFTEELGFPYVRQWLQANPVGAQHTSWMEIISSAMGAPVKYANQDEQKQILAIQLQDQAKLILDDWRSSGRVSEPNKRKLSAMQKKLNEMEYAAAGRP